MLLIGYGNPGRGDDGLGPAFAERIALAHLPGTEVRVDYQLTVDHALLVSGAERVVFSDAGIGLAAPYVLAPLTPATNANLMSHSLSPGHVLALAQTLYGRRPEAFVLGIAGAVFGDVREVLSDEAMRNLELAVSFFVRWAAREAANEMKTRSA